MKYDRKKGLRPVTDAEDCCEISKRLEAFHDSVLRASSEMHTGQTDADLCQLEYMQVLSWSGAIRIVEKAEEVEINLAKCRLLQHILCIEAVFFHTIL